MNAHTPVPFNDSGRRLRRYRHSIDAAVKRVLDSGRLILGPETESFEGAFAAYVGAKHCVALGNGTDALEIALRCLDLPKGGLVATTANAGMYATTAILAAGLRPLFVDVDARTANMSPAALESALDRTPAAVIITHLYGRPADLDSLCDLARDSRIPVIEDCAQAHGARHNGLHVGTRGEIGCFSFYPTKNFGGIGDGGAIVTDSPDFALQARRLRQYGWERKYKSAVAGGRNSRMDELHAAVLRDLLPQIDADNVRRKQIAARYDQVLADVGPLRLAAREGENDVAHLYVAAFEDRETAVDYLVTAGVGSAIHYPIPDHLQPCLTGTEFVAGSLTNAEWLCDHVVSLPCFPELTDAEVDHVIDALSALGKRQRGVSGA